MKLLEERFRSGRPEFLILYGRRRVGKTELVSRFIEGKPSAYFLAEEKKDPENLKDMQEVVGGFLNEEEFKHIRFDSWVHLFQGISARLKERAVIVIDEFPYLVRENRAVPSEFQKIWDTSLSKSGNVMLLLVGSSVSMMEKLLGKKSPLHGRRTAQMEIKPMDIFEAGLFLPHYGMEDCIIAYGATDGIPLYLKQFDGGMPVYENIKKAFFRRDALLYGEVEFLLKQEFREPANYFSILKALSFGNTKQNEIVNYTGIEKSVISKYIRNLEEIRVIRNEHPVTDRKERKRNRKYAFCDNYFRFWFRFVYPNKSLIERGLPEAFDVVKKGYGTYLGAVFEKVAEELLWKIRPFSFTRIGRWWHKDAEIDLVALDEEAKKIFFFECKWKNLGKKDGRSILEDLKAKAPQVDWNTGGREERFGIIAKHIEGKSALREAGFFAFDLRDFPR